jgi:vacuolar-type H+-ATPase subunit E/Vma4
LQKAVKPAEMLEREYGKYHVKIYFAKDDVCEAEEKLLDTIMQSYRQRMGQLRSSPDNKSSRTPAANERWV